MARYSVGLLLADLTFSTTAKQTSWYVDDLFLSSPRADTSILSLLQVGTHADSLIASAVSRNVTGFDLELAYEAVKKDSESPPLRDTSTLFVLSSTLSLSFVSLR